MKRKKLDIQEKKILKELVIDPRLSDNQVSKKTGVPVKTVNRKRKLMEEKKILNYITRIEHSSDGTGDFTASMMYIITFKYGLYRKQFLEVYSQIQKTTNDYKHIRFRALGEKDGHLQLILIIESRQHSDILEIFNVEIVRNLHKYLGTDAISSSQTIPLTNILTEEHNYERSTISKGKLPENISRDLIFVGD